MPCPTPTVDKSMKSKCSYKHPIHELNWQQLQCSVRELSMIGVSSWMICQLQMDFYCFENGSCGDGQVKSVPWGAGVHQLLLYELAYNLTGLLSSAADLLHQSVWGMKTISTGTCYEDSSWEFQVFSVHHRWKQFLNLYITWMIIPFSIWLVTITMVSTAIDTWCPTKILLVAKQVLRKC